MFASYREVYCCCCNEGDVTLKRFSVFWRIAMNEGMSWWRRTVGRRGWEARFWWIFANILQRVDDCLLLLRRPSRRRWLESAGRCEAVIDRNLRDCSTSGSSSSSGLKILLFLLLLLLVVVVLISTLLLLRGRAANSLRQDRKIVVVFECRIRCDIEARLLLRLMMRRWITRWISWRRSFSASTTPQRCIERGNWAHPPRCYCCSTASCFQSNHVNFSKSISVWSTRLLEIHHRFVDVASAVLETFRTEFARNRPTCSFVLQRRLSANDWMRLPLHTVVTLTLTNSTKRTLCVIETRAEKRNY